MGRKTFESIGRALPNRTNVVITRNPDFKPDGVIVAKSLEEAIKTAEHTTPSRLEVGTPLLNQGGDKEIFIIGGGEIYRQAIPLADKLYLTLVESDAEGDVFFPYWSKDFTRETFREERTDTISGLKYAWVDLER